MTSPAVTIGPQATLTEAARTNVWPPVMPEGRACLEELEHEDEAGVRLRLLINRRVRR